MRDDPTSPEPTTEELLHALMAGEMQEEQRAALLERLRNDPTARETYGSVIEMEAMLHHEFPRMAEFREPAPLVRRPQRVLATPVTGKNGKSRTMVGWGIAAALLLSVAAWWGLRPAPAPVLVEGYGEWSWLDAAGRKHPLEVGQTLGRNGALVTEGTGSFVKLRFADKSTVVLSGEGELKVPGEKSKRLVLRNGNLEVEMTPQPAGRPAYVETATARVEVVGTRFSVDATSSSTTVAVTSGKVRFKRLADGDTVDIPQERMVTATLDARSGLEARSFSSAPVSWRAVPQQGGYFTAQPFRAGGTSAQPIIHHGVMFRQDGERVFDGMVELGEKIRLRVKFRVADPRAQVRIFLHCRDGKGGFAGNREVKFRASSLSEDATGWRVYEGDIGGIGIISPANGAGISGTRLANLSISVLDAGDLLQISEAEIRD